MANDFGFRYQPGAQDTSLQKQGAGGPQTTVPQEAIRTLSLRVPQTTSTPGLAPLPLLNAKGGGGSDLDMLLQALLSAFSQGGGGGLSRGGSAAPRIIPGTDDPNGNPGQGDLGQIQLPPPPPGFMGGNTGIGNTGRPHGPLGPASQSQSSPREMLLNKYSQNLTPLF